MHESGSNGLNGLADEQLVRLSKWISLRLRHDPAAIALNLDAAGWASVEELIAASAGRGVRFDREALEAVVAGNDKRRFEFDESGARIRARQGHSIAVDLGYADAEPPAVLFHGTATRFLPGIRSGGLLPMNRHDVHLSADATTARNVGARHGRAIVLAVDAAAMVAQGHTFRVTGNGVWLTAAVPPRYLSEPEHAERHHSEPASSD
ncbi:RNA 2'-phosphotransferase [Actinocrinis puniceicyclus]|uniref:Probable RNA 2'-phosphotransferase n=1 Tax=Actinocrinis puniceicyclus TaxID=977794 RepID=A0A8J8BEQ4_9ACTN|nr:RNA 2'-phosphotransferase [Actinocrinis puniceicyclus]MBS2963984.1 RNA 2'-phosphotransferase [Actinocrinis puniceicyclus]